MCISDLTLGDGMVLGLDNKLVNIEIINMSVIDGDMLLRCYELILIVLHS